MSVTYLKHPKHGAKVASSDVEANADKVNGWVEFDPYEAVVKTAEEPSPEDVADLGDVKAELDAAEKKLDETNKKILAAEKKLAGLDKKKTEGGAPWAPPPPPSP